jgi:hypothetical protein
MQFAIAMTLVVLLSTIVLLYQFWTGSHLAADDEAEGYAARLSAALHRSGDPPVRLSEDTRPAPAAAIRADTAA